jgi:hypothetical protein
MVGRIVDTGTPDCIPLMRRQLAEWTQHMHITSANEPLSNLLAWCQVRVLLAILTADIRKPAIKLQSVRVSLLFVLI